MTEIETSAAIEAVQRLAQAVLDNSDEQAHAAIYEDLSTVENVLRVITPGLILVAVERARHPRLGYDAAHDRDQAPELLDASAAYARHVSAMDHFGLGLTEDEAGWPVAWKPGTYKPSDSLQRTTVKSVALGLAALDDLIARGRA